MDSDAPDPLRFLAQALAGMPDANVESELLTFDMLAANTSRSEAGGLLRDAAAQCRDPARRDRILRAADAIVIGQPCALTENGLSWRQAAELQKATLAEWEEQEAAEQAALTGPDPPPMPHASLWDLFAGLSVRVLQTGKVLHFVSLDYFAKLEGFTLKFSEREIYLGGLIPADQPAIANEGNSYFEPIPDLASLKNCLVLIEKQWKELNPRKSGHIPRIRSELDQCRHWLLVDSESSPAPVCFTAPLAASCFPPNAEDTEALPFRIAFLFAGIRNVFLPSRSNFTEHKHNAD